MAATMVQDAPVVETTGGKLRGAVADGIASFKGIPYGASTAGANRFMPPRKPEPWTGVRDALTIAGRSPQAPAATQRPELATVWGPVDTLPVSEDCLTLHLWTPGTQAEAKRPVMVWLHGGAFSYGSANTPRLDGTNLARRGDVVVVAVNHRLNIFGHLHLAEIGGADFARSGNAGLLDLVQALHWVRDNIAAFGGDPGNVTIFGQSGGGGKVSALMAMPGARGLFHRAIVQSGASVRFNEPARALMLAEAVLKELGLQRDQIDQLQTVPIERMIAAIGPATKTLPRVRHPLLDRYDFGPLIDGKDLPRQPFDPDATDLADQVPLMIGGTKEETGIFLAPDDAVWNRTLDEASLRERLAKVAGGATDRALAIYTDGSPADRLIAALTGSNFAVRTILLAERKAARAKAPVYMYEFEWRSPAFDGRLKSCHSMEIPFVFDNLVAAGSTVNQPGAQALADRMAETWLAFARTGDPANASIPAWPAYEAAGRATMLFGDTCRVVKDPDPAARELWRQVALA